MVTNLPPQAEAQYKKVVASKSKEEKLENLRIFLSMIPEHKGTDRLRAQIKRQISRLQDEILVERKRRSSRTIVFDKGENTILMAVLARDKRLLHSFLLRTNVFSEALVSESLDKLKPLSTGFEDIVLGFIPLSFSMMESQRYSLIQTILFKSDLIIVLLNTEDLTGDFELIKNVLRRFGIYIALRSSAAFFKSLRAGGITVMNKSRFLGETDAKKLLMDQGMESGIVYFSEFTSLYTLESSVKGLQRKNFLLVVDKHADEKDLADGLEISKDSVIGIERFLKSPMNIVFEASELIRIYLKPPSASIPSSKPMLVASDVTVEELASKIHGGLSESLKYARLWRGGSSKPLRVGPSFKLMDRDVIEIRTR